MNFVGFYARSFGILLSILGLGVGCVFFPASIKAALLALDWGMTQYNGYTICLLAGGVPWLGFAVRWMLQAHALTGAQQSLEPNQYQVFARRHDVLIEWFGVFIVLSAAMAGLSVFGLGVGDREISAELTILNLALFSLISWLVLSPAGSYFLVPPEIRNSFRLADSPFEDRSLISVLGYTQSKVFAQINKEPAASVECSTQQ